MVVVGVHPKGGLGPRVVINVAVPGATVPSLVQRSSIAGNSGQGNLFETRVEIAVDVPGVGVVRVELPSGLEQLGVPEVQFELPCVEIKPAPLRRSAGWCIQPVYFHSAGRPSSRWLRELEAVDSAEYDGMRVGAYEESVLERRGVGRADGRAVSPIQPFQDFTRSSLDDDIDLEMRRVEMGEPQLQRFAVRAPKEVVLQNMIPVVVEPAKTVVYCLWPNGSKERAELQFHLPTIASHRLEDDNAFVNPSASDYDPGWGTPQHLESLFSPGWCVLSLPQDETPDLPSPADAKRRSGIWPTLLGSSRSRAKSVNEPPPIPTSDRSTSSGEAGDSGRRRRRLTLYQVMAHAPKPIAKDFRDLSLFPFKLPGVDAALLAVLPGDRPNKPYIRVRMPTCRDLPLHRQQTRVAVPGVGSKVPIEILASDVVLQPGVHGRLVQSFGYLPWSEWWGDDPLVTQQAVPRVDEIFFDFPCVELPASTSEARSEKRGAVPPQAGASKQYYHHRTFQREAEFGDAKKPGLDVRLEGILFGEASNEADLAPLAERCRRELSEERRSRRAAAAEAASCSMGTFYEGSPIHHQRFQIIANEKVAAEAADGRFSRVAIPHLGSVTALFPADSRPEETRLLFELPTLNKNTVFTMRLVNNVFKNTQPPHHCTFVLLKLFLCAAGGRQA
jgi:hypothetical protein